MIWIIIFLLVVLLLLLWTSGWLTTKQPAKNHTKPPTVPRTSQEVPLGDFPMADVTESDIKDLRVYLKSKGYPIYQIEKIIKDVRHASVDASLVLIKYRNLHEPMPDAVDDDCLEY